MKEKKTYSYIERNCPICNSAEYEHIKTISGKRQGIRYEHQLEAHVSVCKDCGFIYTNPAVPQEELTGYYSDMLSVYESESSYNIDNRLALIKKYERQGIIAEIGANEQGVFKEKLETLFEKYISVDININCDNSLNDINDLNRGIDMLVGYYVLEHIRDLRDFVSNCYSKLNLDGIVIIEVPDATIYYREPHPLDVAEHVNHFTPYSLTRLMCQMGFECLEINRVNASRIYSFVGIYKKSQIELNRSIDYLVAKSLLLEGVQKIEYDQGHVLKNVLIPELHKKIIEEGEENVAFWCANEMLIKIIDLYIEVFGAFEGLIIDEDIRKKDFYLSYKADTSREAWESGKLGKSKVIFICSDRRVKSIVETLKKKYNEYYNNAIIYFIDENFSLHIYEKN